MNDLSTSNRYELLVQSVTDYAIYMLDPQGVVTSWNAGAERFKGYRAEEIIGEHFSRFYTPEDLAAGTPARALATAETAGRFEAEGWRLRKDGTRFWANVVIDPVRDPAGRLIGFAKVTRDLTERREAQRALEAAQEALRQSQKMEAIGKLTGGVAHDFNNLLAAILGSLELAKRRLREGADITRFLDNATQAAERGAALTQRMLSFARKQELKLETIDVTALVRGMADLLQRTMAGGVAIETRFPLTLLPARVDAGQLELALLNLAVNARDAMPRGGRIVIAATEECVNASQAMGLEPGCYIRLAVIDQGEGMDADTLARAMEPFFTTKGIGKGTGLGLSMVHGFAEQCGGRLVLESTPGSGTTAALWLPVAEAGAVSAPSAVPGVAIPRTAPMTVLAVDDDALVLLNTVALLEEQGHRVLSATSGREALRLLESEAVDLVFTDYAMPEMNGVELARAVQSARPGLRTVLVSGFADLPPGAANVLPQLSKPFREDDLARMLATCGSERCIPAVA